MAAEDPALLGQKRGPRPHLADESREAHALDGPRFCAQQPELSVAKLEMQHLQLVTPVESLQDEGACWAPNAIWPSIMLTHWGCKVYTASGISHAHCAFPRCQEFELHLNATIWQSAYQGAELCNAQTQAAHSAGFATHLKHSL